MYVCMHVCMYVCMYGEVLTKQPVHICIHVCILCMYVCMYAEALTKQQVHICMYVCMYVCMQRLELANLFTINQWIGSAYACTYVHTHVLNVYMYALYAY